MMQQLMQVRIVIIDVSHIRSVIVVLLQYCERNLAVDAHTADGYAAFRTGLLLDNREHTVLEIIRTDSH